MYTHVTAIPSDSIIIVDQQALRFSYAAPEEIHALQWRNGSGHIEYTDNRKMKALAAHDYAAHILPFVLLWEAEKAKREEEANKPPTLEEARAAKLAEIVTRANEVKAALSSRFSALEEGTWPEQEAGARKILNDSGNVKDKTARLILLDDASTAAAVTLVKSLAAVDGASNEDFAARIVNNADISYQAGIATLIEQRSFEAAANAAQTVAAIQAVAVQYAALRYFAQNA